MLCRCPASFLKLASGSERCQHAMVLPLISKQQRRVEMKPDIDRLTRTYQKAVENDWRTVQSATEQGIAMHSAKLPADKIAQKLNIARSILAGENGHHIHISEIDKA
jgi:hypothetical protein